LSQLFGEKELSKTRYFGLTFDRILDILKVKTKPDRDLSGQEERYHTFGSLFGLQCFVRAKSLSVGRQQREEEKGALGMIVDNLLQLAKKLWVREECGRVIVEALGQMN
jgi:DNA polymerase phi